MKVDAELLKLLETGSQNSWDYHLQQNPHISSVLNNEREIEFEGGTLQAIPKNISVFNEISKASFTHVIFDEKNINFHAPPGLTRTISFDNCHFNHKLNINGNIKLIFTECTFKNTEFNVLGLQIKNSKKHGDCHILALKNGTYIEISNSNFDENLTLSGKFHSTIKLTENNLEENFICADAIFEKSAYFNSTIFNKKATFTRTEFNSFTYFSGCQFHIAPDFNNAKMFAGTDFKTSVFNDTNSKYAYNNYRALKNHMDGFKEYTESNRFYSLEQISSLKSRWFTKGNFWNTILLSLNHISNLHNQSWSRGILFTFVTAFLFFSWYIQIHENEWPANTDFCSQFDHFWTFMLPTHKSSFMYCKTNIAGGAVEFASRIFIGYGIYQTIQAFRKFGRR